MDSWNCANCSSSSISDKFYSDSHNHPKTHDLIRWKSGERVDLKVLSLLEMFGEIYSNRNELFKKIFGENHDEPFKKVSEAMRKKRRMKKARSLSRSLSSEGMKVKRGFGTNEMEADEMCLERFRVRTPDVIVVGPQDVQYSRERFQVAKVHGVSNDDNTFSVSNSV